MKIIALALSILIFQVFAFGQKQAVTVFLAGDSTLARKTADKKPETGWGEPFQNLFDSGRVKIENHAQNGRSTKSFVDEGRWQAILDKLKKGDYVFIEFGHNDQKKEDPKRFAAPDADYRNNLIKFVTEVRGKTAFPVLLTPVVRRRFDEKGEFYDTHGEYPETVRAVAKEYKVPLIDLHRKSELLLKKLGAEESKKLFLILKAGEHPNYPKGVDDNTHFSAFGAEQLALLAAEGLREAKIGLAKRLLKKGETQSIN